MINGKRALGFFFAMMIAASPVSTANGSLYLVFNVGDNEDLEVQVAGKTFEAVRAGKRPSAIDSGAARYFVLLPYATMEVLSGSAVRVGAKSPQQTVSASAATVSEAATDAAANAATGDVDEGDTGWIEYRAAAATLMLFSPDGLDEESEIRFEPSRVFLRRVADGSIYAMITGKNGGPPPAD